MDENILKSRRFLPLMITQFLGALNDNLFKNTLLMTVTITMVAKAAMLSNLIAALFILPFFLFSALAGQIADKYDKASIARILKITELLLCLSALLVYFSQSLTGLVLLLTAMGTQSAFFGPIKYALLPQHLKNNELPLGNAYIEATTYVAILLGLIVGTLLPISLVLSLISILAVFGLCASLFIPNAKPGRPDAKISKNILSSTFSTIKMIYQHKASWYTILGATWFWMIGAFVVVQIYPLSGQILNVGNTVITFFLVLFSVGVAFGSVLCGHLMKNGLQLIYTPLNILCMGFCFYLLYLLTNNYQTPNDTVYFMEFLKTPHSVLISLSIFMMAFFGGLYIVPLNTLMQKTAPRAYIATIIGGNNILNALGMVLISVLTIMLLSFKFTIPQLFLFVAFLSVGAFLYACRLMKNAFWRSILRLLFKLFFRAKIKGYQNIKRAGKKVLFISNHTSLLDGLLVAAYIDDDLTFAINTSWSKKWFMKIFSMFVHFYPLDPLNPMSIRNLIHLVESGSKVVIFPEGRISITGGLMKIYDGAGMIAYKSGANIVPICIKGAIYSKFSYLQHQFNTKYFPHIEVSFLPAKSLVVSKDLNFRKKRRHVCSQIYDLMTNMLYQTSDIDQNIFSSLLESAKIHGYKHFIAEDASRKPLTYSNLIQKAYILGYKFKKEIKEQKVGLLFPNTLANVVSFFALIAVDKVPVMMNFSFSVQNFLSSAEQAGLKTIVTSREFVEKARLQNLEKELIYNNISLIYLEDFAKTITLSDKIKGLNCYLFKKRPLRKANTTAVILFTSGSESLPKAVLLSHKNLQANRYQVTSVLSVHASDVFFNALPMFHSFGLTIGTVTTILTGVKTFFYPSPLHYRAVPELIYDTNTTIVCGTDTFFYGYGRMANPYDFYALKYAIVGGEKLKQKTSDLWIKKFGVRLLEGYGTTETAPVLALNTPMHYKENTVGRFLPSVLYHLEDIEGIKDGQKLWVKADNVMLGYLKTGVKEKIEAPFEGWYDTGDIVSVDDEGFISILGRSKRFAKIGGEMISLSYVESVLEKCFPNAILGVLCLYDEVKGEKLVLVINDETASIENIRNFLKDEGLNMLCLPKEIVYMKNPPLLATGKFDYVKAKEMLI